MNQVILCGRLIREPEMKSTATMSICRFGLAVDRWGKKDEADFFNCTAFGKTAVSLGNYCHKGTKILICGRIQIDTYTAHDGTKKTATQIICNEWEFAESKAQQATDPAQAETTPAQQEADFMDIPADSLDELPFN